MCRASPLNKSEEERKNIGFSSESPLQNQKKCGILPTVSIKYWKERGSAPLFFVRQSVAGGDEGIRPCNSEDRKEHV